MTDPELIKYMRYQLGQVGRLMLDEDFFYATMLLGELIGRMDTLQETKDGQKDQKDPNRE